MDLGTGMIGLGLLGDVAGGISNWQAAQRQRDIYKKQLEVQNILRDPNQVLAGASPYYQANLAALKTSMPDIIRQQVAPQLGMRGIDPSGGQGQLITQQAMAPYLMQAQQDAQSRYIQALTGGQQGLNYAGQNAGQGLGPMNNTAQAMQALMRMQAMRQGQGQGQPSPYTTQAAPQSGGSGGWGNWFGNSPPRGGAPEMDFNPMTAGQPAIENPLTYQYPMASF